MISLIKQTFSNLLNAPSPSDIKWWITQIKFKTNSHYTNKFKIDVYIKYICYTVVKRCRKIYKNNINDALYKNTGFIYLQFLVIT